MNSKTLEKSVYILAIESSCDETSAAVLHNNKVLANFIATQKIHETFGGVVPELASRAHQQNIVPVVDTALIEAGLKLNDINVVAYTNGPGLLGSLLVGNAFAKGISISKGIPLIEVNHMHAHIQSHFIEFNADGSKNSIPELPFVCLTVSGGHTQLVYVYDFDGFELIGETIDDAAGEAFDKVAKILGLPYPGGPQVDILAEQGNPNAFNFPKGKVEQFNFSFSGFKTAFLYKYKSILKEIDAGNKSLVADLCASARKTIVETLIEKLFFAAKYKNVNTIALAGGVSANKLLRKEIFETGEKLGFKVFIPRFEYCTDNAAMIGISAYYKFLKSSFSDLYSIPKTKWSF